MDNTTKDTGNKSVNKMRNNRFQSTSPEMKKLEERLAQAQGATGEYRYLPQSTRQRAIAVIKNELANIWGSK